MPNFNERDYIGDVVLSERPHYGSRAQGTLKGDEGDLKLGLVLGRLTKSSVAVSVEGNTGNGVVTLADPALGPKAEAGAYVLTCITAASNAGMFQVVAPSGYRLPDLTVGVAYAGDHINLTVADGSADFIVGDQVVVNVSGTGEFVPAKFGAVDGSGDGVAVLLQDADTTGDDVNNVLLLDDGPAILALHGLKYHASADTAEKQSALRAGLAAKGIKFVEGA